MIQDLELTGLKLIDLKLFHDDRGFFVERYQEARFKQMGITAHFVQDNHSRSKPGVIRGLHYQHSPGQGKLVSVLRGRILDVVIDIRKDSPTFGKWTSTELSDQNGKILWVPAGFAHGFCVLGEEEADVIYKVDAPYSASNEGGIAFNDPEVGIEWPVKNPIVSPKDQQLPKFSDYRRKPVF